MQWDFTQGLQSVNCHEIAQCHKTFLVVTGLTRPKGIKQETGGYDLYDRVFTYSKCFESIVKI